MFKKLATVIGVGIAVVLSMAFTMVFLPLAGLYYAIEAKSFKLERGVLEIRISLATTAAFLAMLGVWLGGLLYLRGVPFETALIVMAACWVPWLIYLFKEIAFDLSKRIFHTKTA